MPFYAYAITSESTGKIYIGHTDDLIIRLKRHNKELPNKKTSFTSKNKGPWILFHQEEFQTRQEAKEREKYLKTSRGRKFLKDKKRKSLAQLVDPSARFSTAIADGLLS